MPNEDDTYTIHEIVDQVEELLHTNRIEASDFYNKDDIVKALVIVAARINK